MSSDKYGKTVTVNFGAKTISVILLNNKIRDKYSSCLETLSDTMNGQTLNKHQV